MTKNKRPECPCKGVKPGAKPVVCPHWNFAVICPEGAKEWNYDKNRKKPEELSPGSTKKMFFDCFVCGNTYDQQISVKSNGSKCPYCSGKRVWAGNSLATLYPEVSAQWDYEKNDQTPNDVAGGSNKYAYWICNHPKHANEPRGVFSWKSKIGNRTVNKRGCPSCNSPGYESTVGGTEGFIERARKIHGDKYDYSESVYKGAKIKVKIICPEHGIFEQDPDKHVNGSNGCMKCAKGYEQRVGGHEVFVKDVRKIHGDKYEYPDPYLKSDTKIKIVCKEIDSDGVPHGEFSQTPNDHKRGNGCPKCCIRYEQEFGGIDVFIEHSRKVHGDKYDYSKSIYVNNHTKIIIICNEKNKQGDSHGEFLQTPQTHKRGAGCPACAAIQTTSKFATSIIEYLETLGYKDQVSMDLEWTDVDNLRDTGPLKIDIYLRHENLMIEIDGKQHFRGGWHDKTPKCFENRLRKDYLKDVYALQFNRNFIRIPFNLEMDKVIELINYAIIESRANRRIHLSYEHFYVLLRSNNFLASFPVVNFGQIKCPLLEP